MLCRILATMCQNLYCHLRSFEKEEEGVMIITSVPGRQPWLDDTTMRLSQQGFMCPMLFNLLTIGWKERTRYGRAVVMQYSLSDLGGIVLSKY
jgi:hypothetical protein